MDRYVSKPFFDRLPRPIAAVAHDAGAANIIGHLIKMYNIDACIYAAGPAKRIWREIFGNEAKINDSFSEITKSATIITGTGWQSDFEYSAREIATNNSIYNIAFIDHWVNYEDRFIRNKKIIYPNEIIVVDNLAYEIASSLFRSIKIRQAINYYEAHILDGVELLKLCRPVADDVLLYLTEPIRQPWLSSSVSGEFQALDYFLDNMGKIIGSDSVKLMIRTHPSESPEKYIKYLSNKRVMISIESRSSLIENLSLSRYVVGCHSYALRLSAKIGIPTFCAIPPWGPNCALPMDGITYLRDL